MFRRQFLPGLVAVALAAILGCSGTPKPTEPEIETSKFDVPEPDLKELAKGNNEFALDLYKTITAREKGNVVFSPYSISSALAMTYAGARGKTAEEMKNVLHFTLPSEKLHPAFGSVTDSFQTAGKDRSYQLNLANALWAQQGMPLLPGFLEITSKSYGAGVREVDFNNPEAARGKINHWVGEKTQEKIPELLKQGDIDPLTRLVLTNAVYFQGNWKKQFDPANTRPGDFELEPGKKVQVPMMSQGKMPMRWARTPEFSLLELPYAGDRWRMVILLPSTRCGLNEVETKLTAKDLTDAIAELHPSESSVVIPKFKFRLSVKFKEELSGLGMPTAFSDTQADFSGINNSKLYIDNVIHEACIEVDESGTVAAAATAVVMRERSASLPHRVDQPFLFLLRDHFSDTILFFGKVTDPR